MKRTLITVALLAVLSATAASCQKEDIAAPISTTTEIGTMRSVVYTIDDIEHRVTLFNDAEWDTFIDTMMDLSVQGRRIRFFNESSGTHETSSKEILKLTTENVDEAKKWAKEKSDQGYIVSITYKDGKYTCIATR